MNKLIRTVAAATLALGGCSQSAKQQQASNAATPANAHPSETLAPIPPPGTGPDAKTPFTPSVEVVDPKSAEAARQVAQHYISLIEEGRFAEAQKLWDNEDAGKEVLWELRRALDRVSDAHFRPSAPTGEEGAAGSIYITVPAKFSARDKMTGSAVTGDWNIVLRRVNDVPGSSPSQRRWHIHEMASPPVP